MKLRLRWPRQERRTTGLPKIAVMGALRSGTNLVADMLEQHWRLSADFHAYGWKHAGVPILGPSSGFEYPATPIVWICKNPLAQVVSLHRYRMLSETGRGISLEGATDFPEFLRSPITIRDSQLPGSPRLRFSNPMQYWNFITWNLETLDPSHFNAIGFNYEDIVSDPDGLTAVEGLLPLDRRTTGSVKLPEKKMRRGKTHTEGGDGKFDAGTVTSQSHLTSYTSDDLAFVATQVDPWLMQRRRYTLP
ncbi:MAG: hypothetical protein QNL92_03875 [Octadecabacter sp.]